MRLTIKIKEIPAAEKTHEEEWQLLILVQVYNLFKITYFSSYSWSFEII